MPREKPLYHDTLSSVRARATELFPGELLFGPTKVAKILGRSRAWVYRHYGNHERRNIMPTNKEAAQVLAHPNGQRREIAQPRASIVHQTLGTCKVLAAKLALTASGITAMAAIVGLAEGAGEPAAAYLIGSVLIANHAAGVLLEGNREE